MILVETLSGLKASTISYPLEVAWKRLMVGALRGKCPPNMVATLSEVIRDEGLIGLYRAWGASCLKLKSCLHPVSPGCSTKPGKIYCLLKEEAKPPKSLLLF